MRRTAASLLRRPVASHPGPLVVGALLLANLIAFAPRTHSAPATPEPVSAPTGPRGPRWVEGEVLIVFQHDARPEDVRSVLHDLGATRLRASKKSRVERHRIRKPVSDAVAKYRGHPAVRIIEPNYLIHADLVPNDPSFGVQWSLQNTGQQAGTPGADIDAVAAWDRTTGSQQVVVAIIDTGMDTAHPDLATNVYTNPGEIPGNGLDDDVNGYVDDVHGFDFANFDGDPSDDNGHGTHVAGTIGASGGNGVGVAGVVWHVRLLPLKFLDAAGNGTTGDAVESLDYAVMAGASLINASWGSGERSQALELAIAEANEAGVLFVAAAGNTGTDTDLFGNYPSGFPLPNVVSVGSTTRSDVRSPFSSYGATTVDLFAPGSEILSTRPSGQYGLSSGTSMAVPHVSGALALLKSRFPAMGAATMKTIVMASTDRLPDLAGLCVTGGRLNAARMLDGVDSIAPGPIADLAAGVVSSDRLAITWTATGDDGGSGTATDYEVRYSLTPIDAGTFPAATLAAGIRAPRGAGSPEEVMIRGLAPSTDYHIALRALDEYGNASPLSNVITVRTTAPPAVAASPIAIESMMQTGQSEAVTLRVRNDGAGFLDFTAAATGPDGAPKPWLSVAPQAGSARAGGEIPLSVSLNAHGLAGADYAGRIRVTTNDPARPVLDVPVTLHVTSAPDIELFPIPFSFGPVAVGITDTQSISVSNSGFATLHVTSVTVEGGVFAADETPFDLSPGGAWEIFVSATPSQTGPASGALVIACDDPDQPIVRVPLTVSGIVPPTIAISQAHQEATLQTGLKATRTFTVSNTGGSPLSWSLRVRSAAQLAFDSTGALVPAPPLAAPAPKSAGSASSPEEGAVSTSSAGSAQAADLTEVRVVFDARNGAGSGAWSGLIGSLTSRGAVFTVNSSRLTADVLQGADVYWISDDAGAFEEDERAALAAWVRAGGSLLIEGALAPALPEFDALLQAAGVPVRFVPGLGITGPTRRIYPFEITRGALAADIPSSTARLVADAGATVLIEDAQGFPAMAAAFVERGRVLVVSARLFADVSALYPDNGIIASQSFDWLGGSAWLSLAPSSSTIGPGQSRVVTLTFDAAQMAGGDYRAALVGRSNDPAAGAFLVPVQLSVIPAPDVEASSPALDLGSVFVGASRRDSVRVRNVGVLPLHLAAASVDHPDFSAPFQSVALPPGAVSTISVNYAPTMVGPASGTLIVATDDPDEPELRVPIAGNGAAAPDVELEAGAVTASLPTGGTTVRTIRIANRAGSDLEYAIRFEDEAPSASIQAAEGVRASAFPRTWAEAASEARERTRTSGAEGAALRAAALDSLPLVVIDARGDGGVADLVAAGAWARGGTLSVELETATDIVASNFGGYVSLDIDQNRNTGREPTFGTPRQDIGAEFEVSLFSIAFGVVDLLDAKTGSYVQSFPAFVGPRSVRFAIPLAWLLGDDGRIDMTGVIGNFLGATDWFPDRGHGTVGGLWLSPSPAAGTIVAGSESVVDLTLDARSLPGGSYRGTVIVETNDPDEPELRVPAAIEVTDAAIAVAGATRVHLGTVFLGHASEGELLVGNEGRAALHVTSLAVASPHFEATPSSFTVLPGATQPIHLTFRPSAAGAHEGALTLTHDAGSPLSISLTGTCLIAPAIEAGPETIEASLPLGEQGSASFTIRNRGGSPLAYGVEAMEAAPAVAVHAGLDLGRDEEDPRPGIAASSHGGPDGFGYRWVDSNHPGGPVFDWQDISSIGTPIAIRSLDQNSGPLPIGFTFPFYGLGFTTFNVCTHGWISFSDTTANFANQPLPSTTGPANLLAVFWDDLNFAGVERATYLNDGTRLIVQFTNVTRRQKGGPFTFQAILYPSGAIVYQYLLMGPPVTSGTIGIQNRTKTDGLTVVFNADYLRDRMAIRFTAAPGWLDVPSGFGHVDPGDSAIVPLALDARRLFAGEYLGTLRIQTNDPERPVTSLGIRLRATGIPRLAWSPEALRFDTLDVGQSATDTLRITNDGTDRLEAAITFDRPDFVSIPSSLSLAPLQSAPLVVRFAPTAAGDRSASLAIATNDPDRPLAAVPVTAAARLSVRPLRAGFVPAVLRRGSRGDLRAQIVLPPDLDARAVVLEGVRFQGIVPPDLASTRLRDLNGDGRPDLDLAFRRQAAERTLADGEAVEVSITGEVRGVTSFDARGTLRVMGPKLAAPGVELESDEAPAATALRASAPNPFVASASLRFDLAGAGRTTLRVFAANGTLVRTLVSAPLPAGSFRAAWDGRDDRGAPSPSGVYFARLEVAGAAPFQGVRRIVRVR